MKNIYRLDGNLALVTGASKGIGAAVAKALARQGCDLMLLARDVKGLEAVAAEIAAMGRKARVFTVDLSNPSQIKKFVEAERESLKKLDHYINNAAFTIHKTFMNTDLEEFDNLLSVNVKGAVSLTQEIAGHMRERRSGNIVIMTSVNALSPLPSQAMYSSTKAMLEALMKCAASELAPYGVRVNSIIPGAILTDMNDHLSEEKLVGLAEKIPSRRIGAPEEVADVAAFLCSHGARYMYGSSVVVDGGILLR